MSNYVLTKKKHKQSLRGNLLATYKSIPPERLTTVIFTHTYILYLDKLYVQKNTISVVLSACVVCRKNKSLGQGWPLLSRLDIRF
jgi:hypothetical protein